MRKLLSACLFILTTQSVLCADPLVHVWMTGRVAGTTGPFTQQVGVVAGQSVEYRIMGSMAPIGTTNSLNFLDEEGGPITITSLVPNATPSYGDGLGAIKIDIYQDPSDPIQGDLHPVVLNPNPTPAPNDTWAGGTGATGTGISRSASNNYNDLLGVRPIHSVGIFSAISSEVIASGTFDVPEASAGSSSFIRLRWSTVGNASGYGWINHHTIPVLIAEVTEASADPLVGFYPPPATASGSGLGDELLASGTAAPSQFQLVLAPEPSSLAFLAIGVGALLYGRRYRA